jgi:dTDP-4-dehydrorhamnose reductase
MRIVVTGASGRLGRALVRALEDSPYAGPVGPIRWTRTEFDLDDPGDPGPRLDTDRVEAIIHAAAWTDVDGCAREPGLALQRNGTATGVLARACAERGLRFVFVSSNEVFDGRREDRRPYRPDDEPNPVNAYGASKLTGERAVSDAYRDAASGGQPVIARTSWLFGPPGNDFPAKILAAAERARAAGEPVKVVGDEWGNPTYTHDLAEALVDLATAYEVPDAVHHAVNAEPTTRARWARELFDLAGVRVEIEEVPASTWQRASTPPRWGVLEPTPLPSIEPLRPWREALADYLPVLAR